MTPTAETSAGAPKRGKAKSARRGKRANGGAASPAVPAVTIDQLLPFAAGAGTIEIEIPDAAAEAAQEVADGVTVNAETGVVTIEAEDGSVTVDPTGTSLWQAPEAPASHDENLALKIDPSELSRIAEELVTAIEQDKSDRAPWEQIRAKVLELVGLKLEDPKPQASTSNTGVATSVVRDPVLLEAVERFRANAFAELCPARGPVKVVNWGAETAATDALAIGLQKDLNFYLTTIASEYYPDTNFMLWWTGLASGTFKKVYRCPLRRRPVSEYVDGTHLIVPSNATDLKNAGRVTHEITMRRSTMKRMQILGIYRNIDLFEPLPQPPSVVDEKKAAVEGKAARMQRPEDQEYTLYECYCELDIKGFEHTEKDKDGREKPTGLPLPYRVTIDAGSRQILEIRRNWEEDDKDHIADIPFVLFPYSMSLSRIYGSGLGQMGGNIAAALTALLRISIDNGMFANYPGLLKAKGADRQLTNHLRVPPGGMAELDIPDGMSIQQAVMAMPFKDVSGSVMALMEQMRGVGQRLMGSGEMPVAEGRADVPVGTILAMIEQGTKILAGVHKMLHTAQSEEFRLLVKLFRADPAALWRGNPKPALGADDAQRMARFKQALDQYAIVPMADPNVPSEMHRILKAMALKQLTMGNPAYDQVAVDRRVAQVMQVDDFDSLVAKQPPGPPPIPPAALVALQLKIRELARKEAEIMVRAQTADKDRQSRENIEAMRIAANANSAEAAAAAKAAAAGAKAGAAGAQGVDPLRLAQQATDAELKSRKLDIDAARLMLDAHEGEAERRARQTDKAMDIAARLATHPAADAVVDEQLQQMAPFISPANADGGAMRAPMGDGGAVGDGGDGVSEHADVLEAMQLAMEIADALSYGARAQGAMPFGAGFVPPMAMGPAGAQFQLPGAVPPGLGGVPFSGVPQ